MSISKKVKMIWRILVFGSKSWHKNCELILVERIKKRRAKWNTMSK